MPALRLVLLVAAVVAIAAALGAMLLAGGSSRSAVSSAHYGGLPSWLPKPKVKVDRVLQGSPGRPAISIQGEPVLITTAAGHVLARSVGPEVPEEGRFPVPAVTPTTFLVTFASASAPIPLARQQFAMVDERGALHRPHVTAMGGGPIPARVPAGRPLTLELHAILPTGSGALTMALNPATMAPVLKVSLLK